VGPNAMRRGGISRTIGIFCEQAKLPRQVSQPVSVFRAPADDASLQKGLGSTEMTRIGHSRWRCNLGEIAHRKNAGRISVRQSETFCGDHRILDRIVDAYTADG